MKFQEIETFMSKVSTYINSVWLLRRKSLIIIFCEIKSSEIGFFICILPDYMAQNDHLNLSFVKDSYVVTKK